MKIPEPKKMSSGRWYINLRLGGRSYSFTEETKKACKDAAALFKAQYKAGQYVKPSDITLKEACEKYIESRGGVLSPSTVRGYKSIIKNRFSDVMDEKLSDVKDWQYEISKEAEECSAKTVRNSWEFISSVLKENGVDYGKIRLPQVVRKEHPFLEPEQIKIFVKAIEGSNTELAMLLGLHGLRRSEILALRKEDVSDGFIHVRGAVVYNEDNKRVRKDTNKNETSRRDVPILISRVNVLVEDAKEGEPLCPIGPDKLRRDINRVCKDNGLPEVGTHGLRHSFASLCFHLGLSELETMKMGGWKTPEVMKRIYTHLAKSRETEAVKKLTSFFDGI